jgi:hypothetical protein
MLALAMIVAHQFAQSRGAPRAADPILVPIID